MKKIRLDFTGENGLWTNTDYRQEMNLRDNAGDIIDLTGYHVRLDIRDKKGNLIIRFDSDENTVLLSDQDPNLVLVQSRDDTGVKTGWHNYDMRVYDGDMQIVYIYGSFEVVKTQTEVI